MTVINSNILTRAQAAEFLGLKPGTLAAWASNHRHSLPFIKVGRRVRYLQSDLEAWLLSRRIEQPSLQNNSRNYSYDQAK